MTEISHECDSVKLSGKEKLQNCKDVKIPMRSMLIFLTTTIFTAIFLELLPFINELWNTNAISSPKSDRNVGLKYAVYGKSLSENHLVHVFNVVERMGYVRVPIEQDWDLLWAHDYPFFSMSQKMRSLKSQQIVNHIPGCGFLTNKVDLSTLHLPFMPLAFRLPSQREAFQQYTLKHPESIFVEKHNEHRHIRIRSPKDVNLSSSDSFVQEYIQNPLLIDGYKFDIGVYVLITSVNPLRVYIYTGDVLFRYCPVPYYPFDANNVDKYVVGDDYLPTWQVPSLVKYFKSFSGSMRDAFDAYLRDQQKDPFYIWQQVEEIIRQTILAKEKDIVNVLRSYKSGKFFDMMRFDLMIDDSLTVHLLEANMSPNLSSEHFKPNSLLYEQIIYSTLNLVGVGSSIQRTHLGNISDNVNAMVTAEKNLATNLNQCSKHDCDISCNLKMCDLCLPCISGSDYNILEQTHREHLHRVDMKRIFPKAILQPDTFDIEFEVQNMTMKNEWLTRWFHGKCMYDRNWCS